MLLLKIGQFAANRACMLSPVKQHAIATKMTLFTGHFLCQRRQILVLQQKLQAAVCRSFSRQTPRLPLDAEALSAIVKSDVTVFTYSNKRFFLLLTIFGVSQFVFWANIASFIKYDPTVKKAEESTTTLEKKGDLWVTFYANNRTKIATVCFGLGCFALFITMNYPLRSVSRLTLIKGGKELGVTTYWHFGRTRYFSVPLDSVSCKRSRTASPTYAAMKIRGHWFYYLLDTRDGRFHEPELFDYVIGLNRSLK